MDTITTAIVTALAGLSNDAIKDSYNALKSALKKKFGSSSELVEAIDKLEKKPDSEECRATLQEEVQTSKVNNEPDVIQLAQELCDKINTRPGGQRNISIAEVKASGEGSAAIGNIEGQVGSIGGIYEKK